MIFYSVLFFFSFFYQHNHPLRDTHAGYDETQSRVGSRQMKVPAGKLPQVQNVSNFLDSPQKKQPEGLTVNVLTARSGRCVWSCRLPFVPTAHPSSISKKQKKKTKKKPWSPFCIFKLHPVQKCSGKICSCTVSWRLLNVLWFGRFLSAFFSCGVTANEPGTVGH